MDLCSDVHEKMTGNNKVPKLENIKIATQTVVINKSCLLFHAVTLGIRSSHGSHFHAATLGIRSSHGSHFHAATLGIRSSHGSHFHAATLGIRSSHGSHFHAATLGIRSSHVSHTGRTRVAHGSCFSLI